MVDSNLNDLHPDLKPLAEKWLEAYTALGRKAKITYTWRSYAEQEALHVADPNGAAPPGHSKHEFTLPDGTPASKAFDFSLYDEDGQYIEDGTDEWYADAGKIAENLDLVWGGRFHRPDWDHIELKW